jgi:hypothetical protein
MSSLGNALLLAAASPTSTINPADGDAINWKLSRTGACIRKIRPAATGYFVCGGGSANFSPTNPYLATTTDFAQFNTITLPSITANGIGYNYGVSDVCYANNTIIALCYGYTSTTAYAILLKSTNNGSTWTQINLGNYVPNDIVFCNGRWLVSTTGIGMIGSSDNFVSSAFLDSGLTNSRLAVSGNTVIAGHSSGLSVGDYAVGYSVPGFINRTSILTALGSSTNVYAVEVDPDTVGDVIYVLTDSGAVAIWNNYASSQLVLSGQFGGFYAYARVGNRRIISGTYYGYTSITAGPTNGGAAMTWSNDSRFSNQSCAIASGNNITIVGGSGYVGTMAVSGSTFTYSAVSGGSSSPHRLAAYGNGTFVVAKSTANAIITSTDDGKSWTSAGQNNAIVGTQYCLKFLNGKFYMGCGGGKIYYSTDGKTWTAATVNGNSGISIHYDIEYMSSGRLVAVGTLTSQGGYAISYISDDDGLTWNRGTSNFPTLYYNSTGITLGSLVFNGSTIYAYSTAGNSAFYSTDGSTWAMVRSAERAHTSIAYSPRAGTFVAVGQGIIQYSGYSTNSPYNWIIAATPNATINKVIWVEYGEYGEFVAVGNSGFIATSQDGANWTIQPALGTGTLRDIIYVGGRFSIASGTNILSTTALTVGIANTVLTTNNAINAFTQAGSNIIAVGDKGQVYVSYDGLSWSNIPQVVLDGSINSIVYHPFTSKWWAILADNGALAGRSSTTTYVYSSTDGVTWTENAQLTASGYVFTGKELIVRNGILTLLGTSSINSGTFYYEYDTTYNGKYTWVLRGTRESYTSMTDSGSLVLLTTNQGRTYVQSKASIAASGVDMGNWSTGYISNGTYPLPIIESLAVAPSTGSIGTTINGATYWSGAGTNQGKFWAVTNATSASTYPSTAKRCGTIAYSNDGINWTSKHGALLTSSTFPYNINGIASRAGSSGTAGLLAIADNGQLLTLTNIGNANANFTAKGLGRNIIAYATDGSNGHVVIGTSPSYTYNSFSSRYSTYGGLYYTSSTPANLSINLTWTQVGEDDDPAKFTSVTYGPSGYVAVGLNGNVYSSSGGSTWSYRSSGTTNHLYKVYYASTAALYIAVGENGTVITSSDGTTWTTRNVGYTHCFYDVVQGSISGTSYFVLVGQTGSTFSGTSTPSILYSTTITNTTWTQSTIPTGITKTIDGIGYASDRFVITGHDSSGYIRLADSTNLTSWTVRGSSQGGTSNVSVSGVTAYGGSFYVTTIIDRVFLKWDPATPSTITDYTYTAFTGDANPPTQTWSGKAPAIFSAMSSNGTLVGSNGFMAIPSGSNWTIKCPGYEWNSIASQSTNSATPFVLTAKNHTNYSSPIVVTSSDSAINTFTPYDPGSLAFSCVVKQANGVFFLLHPSDDIHIRSSDGITWQTAVTGGLSNTSGYKDVIYSSTTGNYYFLEPNFSGSYFIARATGSGNAPARVGSGLTIAGAFLIDTVTQSSDITIVGSTGGRFQRFEAASPYTQRYVWNGLYTNGQVSTLSMAQKDSGTATAMVVTAGNSYYIYGSNDGVKWKSFDNETGFTPAVFSCLYMRDSDNSRDVFYVSGFWNSSAVNYVSNDALIWADQTASIVPYSKVAVDLKYSSYHSKAIMSFTDGTIAYGTPSSAIDPIGSSPTLLSLPYSTSVPHKIITNASIPDRIPFVGYNIVNPYIHYLNSLPPSSPTIASSVQTNTYGAIIRSVGYNATPNYILLSGTLGTVIKTSNFTNATWNINPIITIGTLTTSSNFTKCAFDNNRLYIGTNTGHIFHTPTSNSYESTYSYKALGYPSTAAATDMIVGGTNRIILSSSGSISTIDTTNNTLLLSNIKIGGVTGTSLGMSVVAKNTTTGTYLWTGSGGAMMRTDFSGDANYQSKSYVFPIPYLGNFSIKMIFSRPSFDTSTYLLSSSDSIYYSFNPPGSGVPYAGGLVGVNDNWQPALSSSISIGGAPAWSGDNYNGKFILPAYYGIYSSSGGTSWLQRYADPGGNSLSNLAAASKPTAPKANIVVGENIFRN